MLYLTLTLTYDICVLFYDSLTCNSHIDDIDTQVNVHVDEIIYMLNTIDL